MAQKRMFSKQIVNTDAFLDMPVSSQLLYFHLNMEADDDGFVSSPRKIMKILGSSNDDFKVLSAKRFILPFESGICVIKHWLIHNYIRKDTYTETKYLEEKNSLELKENGGYTERQLSVDEPSTQVSIGKVRLDKVSIETAVTTKVVFGEFQNVKLTNEEHSKLLERLGEQNTKILIEELSGYIASKGKKYSSHYATILNWARSRQEKSNGRGKSIAIIN